MRRRPDDRKNHWRAKNLQASAPVAGRLAPRTGESKTRQHDDGGWAIKWAFAMEKHEAQSEARISSVIRLRQSFQIASLSPTRFLIRPPPRPVQRREEKGTPLTRPGGQARIAGGRGARKKMGVPSSRGGQRSASLRDACRAPLRRVFPVAGLSAPWPLGRESVGETNASQRAESVDLLRHGGAWSRIASLGHVSPSALQMACSLA